MDVYDNASARSILSYSIQQNYPNPFNPSTKIGFSMPKSGFVKLNIYDETGKEVSNLVNDDLQAGNYNITFNASGLSSGVYFYTLKTGDFSETKKMILAK